MEMKMCRTCKFRMLLIDERPCATCSEVIGEYGTYNYQPRLKRKELEARIEDLERECEQYKAEREVAIQNAEANDKELKELRRYRMTSYTDYELRDLALATCTELADEVETMLSRGNLKLEYNDGDIYEVTTVYVNGVRYMREDTK